MRLIDVNTLELKEFFGCKTPQYAILSHTWDGDKEVTFEEWERRIDDAVICKEGYAKIVGACRLAQADGLQYLCSAELTEAINSMFAWYRDSHAKSDTFAKSRWFTRGWTLQELLAPSKVIFLDSSWTVLGDRSELAGMISEVTRIHISALKDRSTIHHYSIAQRMSWAANRATSRTEDVAYCLLGLFDINMPLLLQQEIMKVSNDQSILAALAQSPAEFRFCGSIVDNSEIQQNTYSITNLGIHMKTSLIKTLTGRTVFIKLNCAKGLFRGARHSKLPEEMQVRVCDIFVRTHHPSSKIFFGESYSMLGYTTITELFLSLDASQPLPQESHSSHAALLRRRSFTSPIGVHVTISAGKAMSHDRRVLRQVYPLGDISILQLKCRSASRVSHQLISSGNLSIIFSVFWNEGGSPQEWLHTTIFDPMLKISSRIMSQVDWNCLFVTNHIQPDQCCNSSSTMRSLHERLRQEYGESLSPYIIEEKDPIITIEHQPLQDSFGRLELIVDIIFREPPRVVRPLDSAA
ncbi:HET-domain-containing protein [Hypoxylon sp. FL0890]|nr:HET-domain-containing protein [Hypoxylon sp. FL0890]